MATKIKRIKKAPEPEFPLTYDDLELWKFYECNNGTIVQRLNDTNFNSKIGDSGLVVNIANGVGNYNKRNHTYKRLGTGYICIDLDASGCAKETNSHFFPM